MRKIYLISKYVGMSKGFNKFHFIGYFSGQKIKAVYVKGGSFEINEDYVLLLTNLKNKNTELYSHLVRYKKVF